VIVKSVALPLHYSRTHSCLCCNYGNSENNDETEKDHDNNYSSYDNDDEDNNQLGSEGRDWGTDGH
jgi:hypothetical protein